MQVGVDIGEGSVVDVCMSPDQRYAIIVGSTGQAAVVDGTLVATDIVTNDLHEVARLAPGTNWSVAGSAAMC